MLLETSLIVQWLNLHIPNSVHLGSIPDQGTEILLAAIKTTCSHIRKKNKNFWSDKW